MFGPVVGVGLCARVVSFAGDCSRECAVSGYSTVQQLKVQDGFTAGLVCWRRWLCTAILLLVAALLRMTRVQYGVPAVHVPRVSC
jgi:hypothetical protein